MKMIREKVVVSKPIILTGSSNMSMMNDSALRKMPAVSSSGILNRLAPWLR